MKCPKCEAPMPPAPHKNHRCYRCGEPHPAIAQNEAAQRLAQIGGDSSNEAEQKSKLFNAAMAKPFAAPVFIENPVRPKCTCPPKHRIATCELHGHIVREPEVRAIVDPTTNAIEAIARERDELRATVKGMSEAIAPAVLEQAARNERSALAARDVALERADRNERENDSLHAFRRSILSALGMPENGDAISKVRALMSHDRTDVLERDLAGVREQLDITRRKLDERHHTIEHTLPAIGEITKAAGIPWPCIDRQGHHNHSAHAAVEALADMHRDTCDTLKVREQQIERQAKMIKEGDLYRAALENQINAAHRILEKRALPPGDLITRLQAWTDIYQALADDRMKMHRELADAHAKAHRRERERDDAIASARTAEREMNAHREARSTADHERNLANERIDEINGKWAGDLKRYLNTQAALDKFMGAVADQTIQIMELRSALREVKPDHSMFGGSAQIPDGTTNG